MKVCRVSPIFSGRSITKNFASNRQQVNRGTIPNYDMRFGAFTEPPKGTGRVTGQPALALKGLAVALLLCSFIVSAHSQAGQGGATAASPQNGAPAAGAAPPGGGNLLQQLDLSPEQRTQIRTIREQNKDELNAATRRLRQAQRALDDAVYDDNANETLVEERAREVAAAQAEVVRRRALTELQINRVLTPTQLSKFRALRRAASLEQQAQRKRQQEANLLRQRQQQLDRLNQTTNAPPANSPKSGPAVKQGEKARERRQMVPRVKPPAPLP